MADGCEKIKRSKQRKEKKRKEKKREEMEWYSRKTGLKERQYINRTNWRV